MTKLLALLAVFCLPSAFAEQPTKPPERGEVVLTEAARKLHADCLVIDGHNDLPWNMRENAAETAFNKIDISRPQPKLHTDLLRLKQGGVGAQFWAAYVPVDTKQDPVKFTFEQIDVIRRMCERYPDALEMAYTVEDIRRIRKAGKVASLIGVEGGHSIGESLSVLRNFYRLGVRYMTLTHSANTSWADSGTDEPNNKGLSKFGEDVVREMNRLGMMVDLSHVSPDTMRHAIRISSAPVIFSHSSAYGVAQHPRNVPDDVLKLTAKNGGVVMVNFYSGFIVPEAARRRLTMFEVARKLKEEYPDEREFKQAIQAWEKANPIPSGSIHTLIDHIDHVVKVAGIDHVGLGSDYDGIPTLPAQLEDVSRYPYITQELLNRGYKPDEVRKVLGENLMRAFAAVEAAKK